MSRPTLADVARLAGVAISTASVVLNNKGRVSPATRAQVQAAAQALGYQPNAVARRLASRRTNIVAVVVPSLANPFFATIVHELQGRLLDAGLDIIMYDTEDDVQLEAKHTESLLRNRVDGVVFIGQHTGMEHPNDQILRELPEQGVKLVLVERELSESPIPQIYADKEEGARSAVRHLVSLGHRRIAMVGGFLSMGGSFLRRRGYETALQEAKIPVDSDLIVDGGFTPLGGYQVTRELLLRRPGITALFVANDLMSIGVLKALQESGKRVPEDVSVIGFDNIPESRFLNPSLSTVDVPTRRLGQAAAEVLLSSLEDKTTNSRTIVFPVELIIRDSTGPCNVNI
ncbi:MAG: LacI family transcriptional regulator [Firmicutes bacterium]|nr:LacI family transcriptional regulator [Bacillota bacterium]